MTTNQYLAEVAEIMEHIKFADDRLAWLRKQHGELMFSAAAQHINQQFEGRIEVKVGHGSAVPANDPTLHELYDVWKDSR